MKNFELAGRLRDVARAAQQLAEIADSFATRTLCSVDLSSNPFTNLMWPHKSTLPDAAEHMKAILDEHAATIEAFRQEGAS